MNRSSLSIIFLSFSIFSSNSYADDTNVNQRSAARRSASNSYYKELRKLKNPTPEQKAELKKRILEPARKQYLEALESDENQKQKELSERLDKRFSEAIKNQTANIEKAIEKDEDRQKVKAIFNKSVRGDLTEFNKIREEGVKKEMEFRKKHPKEVQEAEAKIKKDLPPETEKATPILPEEAPQPTPTEEKSLDGTNIPKELVFEGKKQKRPLSPKTKQQAPKTPNEQAPKKHVPVTMEQTSTQEQKSQKEVTFPGNK